MFIPRGPGKSYMSTIDNIRKFHYKYGHLLIMKAAGKVSPENDKAFQARFDQIEAKLTKWCNEMGVKVIFNREEKVPKHLYAKSNAYGMIDHPPFFPLLFLQGNSNVSRYYSLEFPGSVYLKENENIH